LITQRFFVLWYWMVPDVRQTDVRARRTESIKIYVEFFAGPVAALVVVACVFWLVKGRPIVASLLSAVVVAVIILCSKSGVKRNGDVTCKPRHEAGYTSGEKLVMGFRRQPFVWTDAHIPGSVIKEWEHRGDVADKIFQLGMCQLKFEQCVPSASQMPDWIDWKLLDEGCQFFVQMWPFVFYSFAWAVIGGFGAETASRVLLESRYWAAQGQEGRRDTWRRLRETACWLYDVAAHGSEAFKPEGVSWKACMHVRYLHSRMRATMRKAGKWDAAKHGLPINQGQLVGVLLGSSTLLLHGIEELGGTELPMRQKEAFVHLWRVIGFLFGIDDELNPNRSYAHSKIVMDSVFSFGIEANPDPSLSGVLSNHILESIAQGAREDFGAPVTPGMAAMPSWLFLGQAYGKAIVLPEASNFDYLLGYGRMITLRAVLLVYLIPGALMVMDPLMRFLFNTMVKSIRKSQPKCRFGVLPGVCPMPGKTAPESMDVAPSQAGG